MSEGVHPTGSAPGTGPDPLREAAAWRARLNTSAVSAATLEAFRAWRARPGARAAFAQVEAAWRAAGPLIDDPDILEATREANARHRARLGSAARWAAAAALAVIAVGLAVAPALIGRAYATDRGEIRLVTLPDGSRVRLDAESRVRVRLGAADRTLRLSDGRAEIDATADPGRPFVIEAAGVTIRADGARLVVRRSGRGVEVAVLSGAALVRDPHGASEILGAGWSAAGGPRLGRPEPADPEAATDWISGRAVFRNASLADAAAEIDRYAARPVIVEGLEARRARVSGSFEAGDSSAFASAVSALYGLRADDRGAGPIRLSAASRDRPGS